MLTERVLSAFKCDNCGVAFVCERDWTEDRASHLCNYSAMMKPVGPDETPPYPIYGTGYVTRNIERTKF